MTKGDYIRKRTMRIVWATYIVSACMMGLMLSVQLTDVIVPKHSETVLFSILGILSAAFLVAYMRVLRCPDCGGSVSFQYGKPMPTRCPRCASDLTVEMKLDESSNKALQETSDSARSTEPEAPEG